MYLALFFFITLINAFTLVGNSTQNSMAFTIGLSATTR